MSYEYSCKCGTVKIQFKGVPKGSYNCHCHACIATAEFIKKKKGQPAGDRKDGAQISLWTDDQITAPAELKDMLTFVKVGPEGKNVRSYTTCCYTQCTVAGGAEFPVSLRPINRLHTKSTTDGSALELPAPIIHGQADAAFDPKKVPEPKDPGFPCMKAFMDQMAWDKSAWYKCIAPTPNPAFLAVPADVTEVVKITWE